MTELTEEDFKILSANQIGLSDETEMKKINACIDWIKKSNSADYFVLTDGVPRINTQLELRPDIYAVAFVYQLKRVFVEDDASDIEDIEELYPQLKKEENKTESNGTEPEDDLFLNQEEAKGNIAATTINEDQGVTPSGESEQPKLTNEEALEKIQAGVSYKTERLTILGRYTFLIVCQMLLCIMLTK